MMLRFNWHQTIIFQIDLQGALRYDAVNSSASSPLRRRMTYFPDLAPCHYFGQRCAPHLKAIGWLERDQPYRTGDLPQIVTARLALLLKRAYQPIMYVSGYSCPLCHDDLGSRNLFVPGKGFLYVCPELIHHYITVHNYRPPNEFCNAVLRCPRTWTLLYEKRFLDNGGRCFGRMDHTYVPWIIRLLGSLLP